MEFETKYYGGDNYTFSSYSPSSFHISPPPVHYPHSMITPCTDIMDCPQPAVQTKMKKCMALKGLLVDDWSVKFHKSQFISLLDSRKVAFGIAVQDLNRILLESIFTDTERKRIKKLRYQGRNNKAAHTLRIKNKSREYELNFDLYRLEEVRKDLCSEKEHLANEISFYKTALSSLDFKTSN